MQLDDGRLPVVWVVMNIQKHLAPYHEQLTSHPLYNAITTTNDLAIFMSHHIYSVWDFMNLLKTLQLQLTGMRVPWVPVHHVDNVRLINDIVLEEESDIIDGQVTSHFLYYVTAFNAIDPNNCVSRFLEDLRQPNLHYQSLITQPYIPMSVQSFLMFTHQVIQSSMIEVAAAFAYGREILVSVIFQPLLKQADLNPAVAGFISYLERHIELDGGEHGHKAEQMVANLCKTQADWELALATAKSALHHRIQLWDGILAELR